MKTIAKNIKVNLRSFHIIFLILVYWFSKVMLLVNLTFERCIYVCSANSRIGIRNVKGATYRPGKVAPFFYVNN